MNRALHWLLCCSVAVGLSFAVAARCSAPAPAYIVRPEHPRIWLNPEVLGRLRAKAAGGSLRWLALKKTCDDGLRYPSGADTTIQNYALAYQVTRNSAYADRAIALMTASISHGMTSVTADQGYGARSVLPAMAVGYDWCYDRMTPEQRAAFRLQMEQWADWVWPETNPVRATGWAVRAPGDNYFHGFMMTWLVGLALYGDSDKAPGYIDLARQRWQEQVRPYLERFGAGGYPMEGTSYGAGSLFRIFWYLAAHSTATDEDLFQAPGFNWPREAITAKLYLTTPTLDRVYPGGDQARDSQAHLSDYDRGAFLVALSHLDGTTAGYAKWWLDHIAPDRNRWAFTRWEEFLWYREGVTPVDYTQALSTAYLAPGAGWMTSRSGWDRDAVQVCMVCGPTTASHQDRAQNGFMIFRGDWLAGAARLNSHSGLYADAAYNNSLTIGGYSQGFQKSARPLHFADTPRYAYFAGDASDVYDTPVLNLLRTFRRELFFLKPAITIVLDRVDGLNPTLVKEWHLNTLKEPVIDGHQYQTTVGGATLFGRTLVPMEATVVKRPLFLGTGSALSSWRIDVAAPAGRATDFFLNVLEAAPATQSAPTLVCTLTTGRASLIAAQVGTQVVVFDEDPSAPQPLLYQMGDTAPTEHIILNQEPGKWYRLTSFMHNLNQWFQLAEEPSPSTVGPGQLARASDQGVVSFSASVGSQPRFLPLKQARPPLRRRM
jgi:uncharacterized protein DUF4962